MLDRILSNQLTRFDLRLAKRAGRETAARLAGLPATPAPLARDVLARVQQVAGPDARRQAFKITARRSQAEVGPLLRLLDRTARREQAHPGLVRRLLDRLGLLPQAPTSPAADHIRGRVKLAAELARKREHFARDLEHLGPGHLHTRDELTELIAQTRTQEQMVRIQLERATRP